MIIYIKRDKLKNTLRIRDRFEIHQGKEVLAPGIIRVTLSLKDYETLLKGIKWNK